MNADPSCKRQAILPVWYNARFAENPLRISMSAATREKQQAPTHMKIPKATHSCQPITSPPRIEAGQFSAANTGIVDALVPIPIPSSRRQTNSCGHDWVKAEPITERQQKIAEKKMVPRRPKR